MKGIKSKDPMKTRNGRTRLGPLSIAQLEDLISKTSQPKLKHKMSNRLAHLVSRKNNKKSHLTVDTTVTTN
jgi:hypothetical protein